VQDAVGHIWLTHVLGKKVKK